MLEAVAGIATLGFIVASLVVGGRLVLLSRRTHGLPEFVMGFGLLVIAGVGYPLSIAGTQLLVQEPDLARWLLALSAVPLALGWVAVWVFTQQVFRPDSSVCLWFVRGTIVGMGLLMLSAVHYTLALPDMAAYDQSHPRLWANSVMALLAYVWTSFETLRYWGQMRRRVAIGLADPVVTNRFLLFGGVMISSFVAVGMSTAAGLAGLDPIESPTLMLSVAFAGSMAGLTMWLAFMPPKAYLKRVRATSG